MQGVYHGDCHRESPRETVTLMLLPILFIGLEIIFHLKKRFACIKKEILCENTVLEMVDYRDFNLTLPWDLCNPSG